MVSEKTNKVDKVPEFTPSEVKEIERNLNTFTNKEAKQYVISTLTKNKNLSPAFENVTRNLEGGAVVVSAEKQLQAAGGKWSAATAGGGLKMLVENGNGNPSVNTRLHIGEAGKAATAPASLSIQSSKSRPKGGSVVRRDNPQEKTITKKESAVSILTMRAEVEEEKLREESEKKGGRVTELAAALDELRATDSDNDDDNFGTMRIISGGGSDEDNFGTMRIVSGGGDDDDDDDDACGTVRISSSGSGGRVPAPANPAQAFAYREPEEWEKNIVALTRGEWAEGMSEEAFKRWKGKERRGIGSMFGPTPSGTL